MRVSQVVHNSQIYGPGQRMILWTQGCSIRCPGCWNDTLWDFKGGYDITVEEILILAKENNDAGVTILGGEPLDQPEETLKLIEHCHESGLSIMVYTGYEMDELKGVKLTCVESADIVILGRYVDSMRSEELLWRGSTNQTILWNTEIPSGLDLSERRQTEIHIDSKGKMQVLGYPSESTLIQLEESYGSLQSLIQNK
jgi:anaerobic ribonucleoside-triphosphate reductase activating protein